MPRPGSRRFLPAALAALAAMLLAGLGVWQIERRAWKLDLIARTQARVHAAAVPLPRFDELTRADEYRRVVVDGHWAPEPPVLTKAVTVYGSGFWVMAGLRTPEGMVLVNRGFVPDDVRATLRPAAGPAHITGLLRRTEPGGGFLRGNDPAAGRWFSRDVDAIARARGWRPVAPLFVDAEAAPGTAWPRGGLTVLSFPNNHLIYALTWFALAGLAAFFAWRIWRSGGEGEGA